MARHSTISSLSVWKCVHMAVKLAVSPSCSIALLLLAQLFTWKLAGAQNSMLSVDASGSSAVEPLISLVMPKSSSSPCHCSITWHAGHPDLYRKLRACLCHACLPAHCSCAATGDGHIDSTHQAWCAHELPQVRVKLHFCSIAAYNN